MGSSSSTTDLSSTSTSTTDTLSSTSTSTTLGGAAPPAIELPSASSYSSFSSLSSPTDLAAPSSSTDSAASTAAPSLPSMELPGATTSFGGLSPDELSKKRGLLAAKGSTSAHVANAATAATAMSKH